MTDLATGTFVEKIPSWLRWILVIPSALLAPFVFIIIQGVSSEFYGTGSTDSLWFTIIREIVWGAGIVFAASFMAPKKQFLVSIIFLIVLSVFVGLGIFAVILGNSATTPLESILSYILNLGAAAFAVYYIHKEELV